MGPGMSRVIRVDNVATLFNPDALLTPLENWTMELDYRHENGIDFVQKAPGDFLPGIKFHRSDRREAV